MLGVNIVKTIHQHIEAHGDWPDDAVFAVRYKTKRWPCSYGKVQMAYFNDEDSLNAWIRDSVVWAQHEGNSIQYSVYNWDRGPNYLRCDWH